MSDEREKFIEDYLKAFRTANPKEAEPKIWYRGYGWYGFRDSSPFDLSYRRGEIIEMTDRLNRRVAEAS